MPGGANRRLTSSTAMTTMQQTLPFQPQYESLCMCPLVLLRTRTWTMDKNPTSALHPQPPAPRDTFRTTPRGHARCTQNASMHRSFLCFCFPFSFPFSFFFFSHFRSSIHPDAVPNFDSLANSRIATAGVVCHVTRCVFLYVLYVRLLDNHRGFFGPISELLPPTTFSHSFPEDRYVKDSSPLLLSCHCIWLTVPSIMSSVVHLPGSILNPRRRRHRHRSSFFFRLAPLPGLSIFQFSSPFLSFVNLLLGESTSLSDCRPFCFVLFPKIEPDKSAPCLRDIGFFLPTRPLFTDSPTHRLAHSACPLDPFQPTSYLPTYLPTYTCRIIHLFASARVFYPRKPEKGEKNKIQIGPKKKVLSISVVHVQSFPPWLNPLNAVLPHEFYLEMLVHQSPARLCKPNPPLDVPASRSVVVSSHLIPLQSSPFLPSPVPSHPRYS